VSPRTPQRSKRPAQGRLDGTALLDAEAWLRQRLMDHGALERLPDLKPQVRDVTAGVTTTAMRAERMRQLIVRHQLGATIAGRRGGKTETYADLFERVYGEPLITPAMRDPRAALRGKS